MTAAAAAKAWATRRARPGFNARASALKAWETMRGRWIAALGWDAEPTLDDSFDVDELERAPSAAYFMPVEGEPGFEEYEIARRRRESILTSRLATASDYRIRTVGRRRKAANRHKKGRSHRWAKRSTRR